MKEIKYDNTASVLKKFVKDLGKIVVVADILIQLFLFSFYLYMSIANHPTTYQRVGYGALSILTFTGFANDLIVMIAKPHNSAAINTTKRGIAIFKFAIRVIITIVTFIDITTLHKTKSIIVWFFAISSVVLILLQIILVLVVIFIYNYSILFFESIKMDLEKNKDLKEKIEDTIDVELTTKATTEKQKVKRSFIAELRKEYLARKHEKKEKKMKKKEA